MMSKYTRKCALLLSVIAVSSIVLPGCAAVAGGAAGAAIGHHVAKKHRERERDRDADRDGVRDPN